MTLTESSSVMTNRNPGPQKYPHHQGGSHFHVQHGNKTTPAVLPTGREASWLLLPNSTSLLSGGKMQPEKNYSGILKATGQV